MSGEEKEAREPLTALKVQTAILRERDYKLADTGGLWLFVSTAVIGHGGSSLASAGRRVDSFSAPIPKSV
jgi:hypothetical protein